ncbi:MAG: 16S rRNA (uracil(1498)-N(3))-methyltransferase [Bacillota bacterium]|nr:16S rRNA (uracil(1498)-N(3))-methyltransferase [Bacillota bacterium]
MHYFYIDNRNLGLGMDIELDSGDINHAFRVLRLKKNDPVIISDGRGKAFRAEVVFASAEKVTVLLKELTASNESSLQLTLLQSLAKGEKMDQVIRQTVELGVSRIIPVKSERSIPLPDEKKGLKRLQRWQSIARSAAAQSRRAFIPLVEDLMGFDDAVNTIRGTTTIVPWELEKCQSLPQILKQPCPDDKAVSLFIGPEGGFSSREIEVLQQSGAVTVHLGPRIMRTETASVVTVALIEAFWGDYSGEVDRN